MEITQISEQSLCGVKSEWPVKYIKDDTSEAIMSLS